MTDSRPAASVPDQVTVRLRRSPRYGIFLALGAAVGLLVALILTTGFQGTFLPSPSTGVQYTSGQVLGFVALICIPLGMAVFGLAALVLDRVLNRRVRSIRADYERVRPID